MQLYEYSIFDSMKMNKKSLLDNDSMIHYSMFNDGNL